MSFDASLLTEMCHNVAIEPKLQPLNGETSQYLSANTDTEARLDVRARRFWNRGQDAKGGSAGIRILYTYVMYSDDML